MKTNAALFLLLAIAFPCCLRGRGRGNTPPSRHTTLQEAVQVAPRHNRDIRIASYTVEKKQHAKKIARSSYLPAYETTAVFLAFDRHAVDRN